MIDSSADFEVWIEAATPKANGNAEAYPARVFSPAGTDAVLVAWDEIKQVVAHVRAGPPNHLWMKGTLCSTTTDFI